MMKKTKEERISDLKEEMKTQRIMTPYGSYSMFHLCEIIGVKNRVVYFNMIDKTLLHKERDVNNYTKSEKKIFDYGLIFNNGFEIRNVVKSIFNLYPADIIEKRERNDSLKLFDKRESKGSLSMFDVKNYDKTK